MTRKDIFLSVRINHKIIFLSVRIDLFVRVIVAYVFPTYVTDFPHSLYSVLIFGCHYDLKRD